MGNVMSGIISSIVLFFARFLGKILFLFLFAVIVFLLSFVLVNRVSLASLFRGRYRAADYLRSLSVRYFWHDCFRWTLIDFLERPKTSLGFKEFGFTFFVGRQGSGKTASMVNYLNKIHKRYPSCIIVTNFRYEYSDFLMVDWRDLLNVRNGEDGVVFALDEIHSEYSASSWKDVPETLLSEISQQRKQRVKIVATAQYFTRIAKPLREQAFSVVTCSNLFGRLVFNRMYDATEYALVLDNPNTVKKKLRPMLKTRFIMSDALRDCYDTFEKIERMKKIEFIPRHQRREA